MRSLPCSVVAIALLVGAGPATGSDRLLALGDDLAVVTASDQLRVPDTGERVSLPPRSAVRTVSRLTDGWLAAGTQRIPDGGSELLLFRSTHGAIERLSAPTQRRRSRGDPVPLVAGGELVGLAWLEGDGVPSSVVRAARWDGVRWSPPATVAPPAPGSQVSLAGAALDDDDWLLVWTAFDGDDDEVVWSRYRGGDWSQPTPVADGNSVPDITPAIVAVDDTALLAWSRYDGADYRLQIAHLDDRGWSAPRTVGGRGGLYPSWQRTDSRHVLVFRHAASRQWVALDVGDDGTVRSTARVTAASDERPILVADQAGSAFVFTEGERHPVRWRQGR